MNTTPINTTTKWDDLLNQQRVISLIATRDAVTADAIRILSSFPIAHIKWTWFLVQIDGKPEIIEVSVWEDNTIHIN